MAQAKTHFLQTEDLTIFWDGQYKDVQTQSIICGTRASKPRTETEAWVVDCANCNRKLDKPGVRMGIANRERKQLDKMYEDGLLTVAHHQYQYSMALGEIAGLVNEIGGMRDIADMDVSEYERQLNERLGVR